MKQLLTHQDVNLLAHELSKRLGRYGAPKVYPVPRGGVPAAYALRAVRDGNLLIVDDPEQADLLVDDLIDSGTTAARFTHRYPGKPFVALVDKRTDERFKGRWLVFPWETTTDGEDVSANDVFERLLQVVGEDPKREGLLETPARAVKAWRHWCSGYNVDPASVLKVFEDGAEAYDQMIVVKDIPIYSHCEHHLAPIFGTVSIAYIPNGKIVGLSKLSRLADLFARRLQVQERLTSQIADALQEHLQPRGVGVIVRARHMCMESRGVCQQGHHTVTTALRGVLLTEGETRAEFMSLAR